MWKPSQKAICDKYAHPCIFIPSSVKQQQQPQNQKNEQTKNHKHKTDVLWKQNSDKIFSEKESLCNRMRPRKWILVLSSCPVLLALKLVIIVCVVPCEHLYFNFLVLKVLIPSLISLTRFKTDRVFKGGKKKGGGESMHKECGEM